MRISLFPVCFVLLPLFGALFAAEVPASTAFAQEQNAISPMRLTQGVVVGPVVRGGRRPLVADPVQLTLVAGTWKPPIAGDMVRLADGTDKPYTAITANADGWFESKALEGGGYLYATVDSPDERTVLLVAQGNNLVYVNGVIHPGDPYSYGYMRLPVQLHKGTNHFLFYAGRGRMRADLQPIAAPVLLNTDDLTMPDLRIGSDNKDLWAALPIINASTKNVKRVEIQAEIGGQRTRTRLPDLMPLSVRKMGFELPQPKTIAPGNVNMTLMLIVDGRVSGTPVTVPVRVRNTNETYKQTFRSNIDGSIQYFAVNPAQKPSPDNALILSLHGASVEAISQADAYSPKDWATLAAPTNRRPFGFDWEDWGRLDALEVLGIAQDTFAHDPTRMILTGHSMGGHGTWSVGSLFPEKFAAIGPSAGWISFDTYGGSTRPTRTAKDKISSATSLLERAANQYDTFAWGTNLLQEKIYIVHGDADDNVPVEQARQMRAQLKAWGHTNVDWHEEKGAGHWWDDPKTPGAECVDWKPMFDLFESSRLTPKTSNDFTFTTVSPVVSASCHWVMIEQQQRMLMPSSVRCIYNTNSGTAQVTAENVACLAIVPGEMEDGGKALKTVRINNQEIPLAKKNSTLYLRQMQGRWGIADAPSDEEKNPVRGSGFKQAFNNRFILVYPTGGTDEENAWGYARARYDAESFLYRGNGSPDVVSDRDFDARGTKDRNVILYGNATINRAWDRLLKNSPVQVTRDAVTINGKERKGDNLVAAFLYPKSDSKTALVGVVGGTGVVGLRLTERLPYFTSGAGFPDILIADPTVLVSADDSTTLGAGYFGNDWQIPTGEFSW